MDYVRAILVIGVAGLACWYVQATGRAKTLGLVRRHLEERDGRLLHLRWSLPESLRSGPGFFPAYEITYEDSTGRTHHAYARLSLSAGVTLVEDNVIGRRGDMPYNPKTYRARRGRKLENNATAEEQVAQVEDEKPE